jgi:hypothetical protein
MAIGFSLLTFLQVSLCRWNAHIAKAIQFSFILPTHNFPCTHDAMCPPFSHRCSELKLGVTPSCCDQQHHMHWFSSVGGKWKVLVSWNGHSWTFCAHYLKQPKPYPTQFHVLSVNFMADRLFLFPMVKPKLSQSLHIFISNTILFFLEYTNRNKIFTLKCMIHQSTAICFVEWLTSENYDLRTHNSHLIFHNFLRSGYSLSHIGVFWFSRAAKISESWENDHMALHFNNTKQRTLHLWSTVCTHILGLWSMPICTIVLTNMYRSFMLICCKSKTSGLFPEWALSCMYRFISCTVTGRSVWKEMNRFQFCLA